jgi:hypothetical protein
MNTEIEFGNPRGAGVYGYIRSAEDSDFMMLGEEARYDSDSNRWFEYMGCGYACWRDGKALQDADDFDLQYFHDAHPRMRCRESFHELEYGNTRDDVSHALFLLMEYDKSKSRTFSFNLDNVTMAQAKEYIAAVEEWHITGDLRIGALTFSPCCGPWCE